MTKSISVSPETHVLLKRRSDETGKSMAEILDEAFAWLPAVEKPVVVTVKPKPADGRAARRRR